MPERLFKNLLRKYENTVDFRLEVLINDLTEKLCVRMKENGITRSELAEKMNVTPAAVTKILRGNNNFTLRTLLILSDAVDARMMIDILPKKESSVKVPTFRYPQLTAFHGSSALPADESILTPTEPEKYRPTSVNF